MASLATTAAAKAPLSEQQTLPLVWIDLEMTGLDINKDRIMEVACIVTDGNLNILERGPDLVLAVPPTLLDTMDAWCTAHHGASGLTAACRASTVTAADAEARLLAVVRRHAPSPRVALLAGNSVHVDREFLKREMPRLVEHLHYRIVDVSTVKELLRRWRPDVLDAAPAKRLAHRALDDIEESISELKHYRQWAFVPAQQAAPPSDERSA
ncbi:mitochondrial oligoribonuclease [Zopfochytrium polystomum]|nr:mitochondrial oligoribonuclease [Zopfochytrium polystomum]